MSGLSCPVIDCTLATVIGVTSHWDRHSTVLPECTPAEMAIVVVFESLTVHVGSATWITLIGPLDPVGVSSPATTDFDNTKVPRSSSVKAACKLHFGPPVRGAWAGTR